jgi:hypothetical protein
MRRTLTALTVLAALGTAADGAAAATAPSSAAPVRPAKATVTGYLQLQRSDAGGTVQALLFCGTVQRGTGPVEVVGYGTVDDPAAACHELAAADGDFSRLTVHPTWMVPALVAPVAITATGAWNAHGHATYKRTYRNSGEAARNCGDVCSF